MNGIAEEHYEPDNAPVIKLTPINREFLYIQIFRTIKASPGEYSLVLPRMSNQLVDLLRLPNHKNFNNPATATSYGRISKSRKSCARKLSGIMGRKKIF